MTPHGLPPAPSAAAVGPGQDLHDRGGATAERMPEAGGTVHRAGARLPRRVMCTKGRPVPAAEYGVMAAALRRRPRVAVAHRAEAIVAQAAAASQRRRMFRVG